MFGDGDPIETILTLLSSRHFGKHRGLVIDNADPTSRGRIQVSVPSVLDDAHVWALPCVPYAGAGVGFYALPDPGTAVWVEFEAGDTSQAIWTGCFWGDGEVPDAGGAAIKILKTTKGTLRFDDGPGDVLLGNDRDSVLKLDAKATVEAAAGGATARQVVGGSGVKSESGAGGTVDVDGPGVSVNNGALKVA